MKYQDAFKNPIDKQEVVQVIMLIIMEGYVTSSLITRRLRMGYAKTLMILNLLEDAGVISLTSGSKARVIIIKRVDQATNAALRQLRKGNG